MLTSWLLDTNDRLAVGKPHDFSRASQLVLKKQHKKKQNYNLLTVNIQKPKKWTDCGHN